MRLKAVLGMAIIAFVLGIPSAHALPADHLTGAVVGTATQVSDPTCPPNFLGVTPQSRLTLTGTLATERQEHFTFSVCLNCCHPGGWNENGGWAEIRRPEGTLRGPVAVWDNGDAHSPGGGGYWGFDVDFTVTSASSKALARYVGASFTLDDPFDQNNHYTDTGVLTGTSLIVSPF